MERILQQIAQNGAQVGFRQGHKPGQLQLPLHRDALPAGFLIVVAGQRIHCSIRAEGGASVGQFGLVLAQVVLQFIQLPGLGQAGDHM